MTFAILLAALCLGIGSMLWMTIAGGKPHKKAVRASREATPGLHATASAVRAKVQETQAQMSQLSPPVEA